jgi:dolichol-phosphate mannosyltransferase
VPIHFTDRKLGSSKLSFREQLRYLQHLRRLFIYRYWTLSHAVQFLGVGFSGLIVNLMVLTMLRGLGLAFPIAAALAIAVSLGSNFALNRRFTFSYARHQSLLRQLGGFVCACSVGVLVQYFVTLALVPWVYPEQLSVIVGIVAGTGFNFALSRYVIFRFTANNSRDYHEN